MRRLEAILFGHYGEKTIHIKDISLTVDYSDSGGRAYASRSSHEEYVSPLYDEIASHLDCTRRRSHKFNM